MTLTTPTLIPGQGLAIVEVSALSAALVVCDAMAKAADVRVIQAELNDFYGYVLKLAGGPADLRAAVEAAESTCDAMRAPLRFTILDRPAPAAEPALISPPDYSPLIQQDLVFTPARPTRTPDMNASIASNDSLAGAAIGMIETQGYTAVLEAIDTACKAADVTVIGKEKLGGGYVTVLFKGDVAAVEAAVATGKARVEPLGKLIAAHVIARPSDSILSLLPTA